MQTSNYRRFEAGFSLIEMMVTLLILSIISAAILTQIDQAQQRGRTEQVRLDNFGEARDFVDQLFRDINQIGYPNSRMVDTTSAAWAPALAAPLVNDNRMAVGLVKIGDNEIWFEGDANGNGNVQSIGYKVNGSGICALCLQRTQTDKITASPLPPTQNQNWGTTVNDVINTPIFRYYRADGTQVAGLPLDMGSAPATLASIKTIRIDLTLQNNAVIDPKTKLPITTAFQGEVSLNNCSMVANSQPMSCQ
jgi:prepilin-type N-terminal cleavage/methylation domain-containing protein